METSSKNELEKKKLFLLENEEYLINSSSLRFGFTHEHLKKYKDLLNWWIIVSNHTIKWNTEIVDEFIDRIFVEDDIFPEINGNDSLPWSIEFIELYEDLWSWELLAQNPQVMGNPVIRNHFYNRLYPYFEDYLESRTNMYNGLNGRGNPIDSLLDFEIRSLDNIKEWQIQNVEELENIGYLKWWRISQNTLLPWNEDLMDKYKDKLDFKCLSRNQSVPWDLRLMKKYEDRIDWTLDVQNEDGNMVSEMNNIGINRNIAWDSEILKTFRHKLNPQDISISSSAKWDIDLLIEFNDFWDMNILSLNHFVWDKVFLGFNEEENLIPLLDIVLEKSFEGKND